MNSGRADPIESLEQSVDTYLQLSSLQKDKMREALLDARDELAEYLKSNPNISNAEIIRQLALRRDLLRRQLADFLTPDQLQAWSPDVATARRFLD